jgi:Na+-driven multidrug efflux pump
MMPSSTIQALIYLHHLSSNDIVNIAFLGNLSKNDLAAAALATSWFNIVNVTFIGGMTAIDTFLTQTYGAKQITTTGYGPTIPYSLYRWQQL